MTPDEAMAFEFAPSWLGGDRQVVELRCGPA